MSELIVDSSPPINDYMKYYDITYYCGNCGHHGYAYFLKGTPKYPFDCKNCECKVKL